LPPIRDKPIARASPWQNGFAERLIGSIRRECVDHVIVLGEAHLRWLLTKYAAYYNELRTHRSLKKDAPVHRAVQSAGRLVSAPSVAGYITSTVGSDFRYRQVAIMDWASRAVLSWRLSNTMDTAFCVAALEEALARFGRPDIFNTDQGSQFTSAAFTGVLIAAGVRISMDGRGRWMDNVFIERLWRSLKHEDVYLKGYADGREAKAGIGECIALYNETRTHLGLGKDAPLRRAVQRSGTIVTTPILSGLHHRYARM
jgi:transposase InsO family protein